MKLIERNGEHFVFEFQRRERQVFDAILELYPVLNPDYHQVSRRKSREKRIQESQAMLNEAMAEQREKNKGLVSEFLREENWEKHATRFRVKVTGEEMEWLLQVLNDIRVGSWVILGKPENERGDVPNITLEQMPYAGALELSGYFQMALLQARES
ncbi:MAG: hypothetical protein H0X66_15835 [Verrucomicrobia bacterium]|nr:hypothetical protein [Verrucomicrobiota bacterium]